MKRRVVELYVIEESYVFVFDKNHLVQKSIQNSKNQNKNDEVRDLFHDPGKVQ